MIFGKRLDMDNRIWLPCSVCLVVALLLSHAVPAQEFGFGNGSIFLFASGQGVHRYDDASSVSPGASAKLEALGRIGAFTLAEGEENLRSAVIDEVNGYAYFGTFTSPGQIVKVALARGETPARRVGAVTLGPNEFSVWSGVIDAEAGYAYFGVSSNPVRVVKIALGEEDAPPTRVGHVALAPGDLWSFSPAVIDPENGFAYFGTANSPGRVVKIALGAGNAVPSVAGTLTLNDGEDTLRSAVIDPEGGHAYFGTGTVPGRVIKVGLGTGATTPLRRGAITLAAGENAPRAAVIDLKNRYAYFGCTSTAPGRVVKISLGGGTSPPSRVAALSLNAGEDSLFSAVLDPAGGHAYFGVDSAPGRVVTVELTEGNSPPLRVGALTLASGEDRLMSAVMDPVTGIAYFGTANLGAPGRVVAVAPGAGPVDPGTPGDINDDGEVNAVDVQLVINAALGIAIGEFDADVNGDGTVNAVDVQLVINAALGIDIG